MDLSGDTTAILNSIVSNSYVGKMNAQVANASLEKPGLERAVEIESRYHAITCNSLLLRVIVLIFKTE